MAQVTYLSHFLDEFTPNYGGEKGFEIKQVRSMCCGDSSNKFEYKFNDHIGTHIDFPFHFDKNGKKINDFEPNELIFNNIAFFDLILDGGELITPDHLKTILIDQNVDCLILRTSFEKYRQEEKYWKLNPGLTPELGTFLKTHFPKLRCIGFDFISASSFMHREIGREAHRSFLGTNNGAPIIIIEDMKLSHIQKKLNQVIVAPLLISGLGGGQVTVLGFF